MAHTSLFRLLARSLAQAQVANLAANLQVGRPARSGPGNGRLSRRRFLKYSALAGGTAVAATALAKPPMIGVATGANSPTVAVIGGGIAGLNAAYQLKKMGIRASVYEAKAAVGGRIQSAAVVGNGLINDLGGCFINSDHEDILTLADELGLELFNRHEDGNLSYVPETAYYFGDRALSEAELAEQLRPLAEQISADATLLDEDWDTYAPALDAVSVADYLNQHADKISVPHVRRLIELTIRTEYGVEPEESSALQLLYNLPLVEGDDVEVLGGSDEVYLLRGGSGRLVERLAAELHDQIHTRMPLVRLASQGDGFRLTFRDGTTAEAEYVILAIPFPVLRHLDLQVSLPDTLKRFIHEVDLGRNEKLFAGFHRRSWLQDQGFANEAWTDQGFASVWEETKRQPETQAGALTFFMGGSEVNALWSGSAYQRGTEFLNRVGAVLPGFSSGSNGQFQRTGWSRDPYTQGGYTNFKPGQYTEFGEYLYIEADDPDERQEVHVDNLIFAGEHLSDAFYGFMNGGAETGRLAAQVVARLAQVLT